jgi:signal transduction histidine kinase
MRRQIAEQQQALERYTTSLEQLVAERTRELVEANATKDIFMSMASHELRTPLTTLKGITQMLVRRSARNESIEPRTLTLLEHSVHRMEILVNDLLTTSLDDAGLFSLHYQSSDMVALCREVLDEYGEQIGSALQLESAQEVLEMEMDRDRIGQVLLNLLSNARKYSPKGAPILVRIERAGDQAIVSVIDQGVGIPPEKLAHIFDRFYRVPEIEIQTGSSAGFGLGLYIAKKIIELHHGDLGVESTPGDGSTFTIALPLRRPAPHAGEGADTRIPLFHSAHSAAHSDRSDA